MRGVATQGKLEKKEDGGDCYYAAARSNLLLHVDVFGGYLVSPTYLRIRSTFISLLFVLHEYRYYQACTVGLPIGT